MEDFFKSIFNMSITSSYIIIAVLIIRLLIRRLPKKYSYFLWIAVGFRRAVPISFESAFSMFSFKPFDMARAQIAGNSTLNYIPQIIDPAESTTDITVGIPSYNTVINDTLSSVSSDIGTNSVALFIKIFSHIWLAGFIIILLYGVVSYVIMRIKTSKAVLVRENIYEPDRIGAPFILGFVLPKIYIPFGLDDETCRYVIAHERL